MGRREVEAAAAGRERGGGRNMPSSGFITRLRME